MNRDKGKKITKKKQPSGLPIPIPRTFISQTRREINEFRDNTDADDVERIIETMKRNFSQDQLDEDFLLGIFLAGEATVEETEAPTSSTVVGRSAAYFEKILEELNTPAATKRKAEAITPPPSKKSTKAAVATTPTPTPTTPTPTTLTPIKATPTPTPTPTTPKLEKGVFLEIMRNLEEQLPRKWIICYSKEKKKMFYYNAITNKSQWNFPSS